MTLACFLAGTKITTEAGECPVEHLQIGTTVRTNSGKSAAVRWLGHRRLDSRRHPNPEEIWPIRILAHAFAPGQPARDLLLSPDHAVFVGGNLIPIRHLINARTIRQQPQDDITYWHVTSAALRGRPGSRVLDAESCQFWETVIQERVALGSDPVADTRLLATLRNFSQKLRTE